MKSAIFLILVLIPAMLFAQEVVAPVVAEPKGILDTFTAQPWFAIAGEIVLFFNGLTMIIPNAWSEKIRFFGKMVMVFDWLALNVFANKNAGAK